MCVFGSSLLFKERKVVPAGLQESEAAGWYEDTTKGSGCEK